MFLSLLRPCLVWQFSCKMLVFSPELVVCLIYFLTVLNDPRAECPVDLCVCVSRNLPLFLRVLGISPGSSLSVIPFQQQVLIQLCGFPVPVFQPFFGRCYYASRRIVVVGRALSKSGPTLDTGFFGLSAEDESDNFTAVELAKVFLQVFFFDLWLVKHADFSSFFRFSGQPTFKIFFFLFIVHMFLINIIPCMI